MNGRTVSREARKRTVVEIVRDADRDLTNDEIAAEMPLSGTGTTHTPASVRPYWLPTAAAQRPGGFPDR